MCSCVEGSDKRLREMSAPYSVLSFRKWKLCKLILLCHGENFLFFIYVIFLFLKMSEWKIRPLPDSPHTQPAPQIKGVLVLVGEIKKQKQIKITWEDNLSIIVLELLDFVCLLWKKLSCDTGESKE